MTQTLPDLATAEWLQDKAVRKIFAVFESAGEEVRIVGGAVRNALMGFPIPDIDIATTATPDKVTALAAAAGLKTAPTGFEHGTVTVVIDGRGFEVTTLRKDIETDGRRAVVRFGRDWTADALRRDFTVNALSVDSSGTVYDPAKGYPDIVSRRIRFIGDPGERIAEDRLRILRFFRLHAEYGAGDPDGVSLSAAIVAREGLGDLSAERIGQEMRKLVVAPRATETAVLMQESGILPVVLGGVAFLGPFLRLAGFEKAAGMKLSPARRLAVLACRVEEDVVRVGERLRLSNATRDRVSAIVSLTPRLSRAPDSKGARRLLYAHGVELFRDVIAAAFAWSGGPESAWRDALGAPEHWAIPKFPLGGQDVLSGGLRGPAVGALLRSIEAWWIEQDFAPDERALRARLQQMMAAAQ